MPKRLLGHDIPDEYCGYCGFAAHDGECVSHNTCPECGHPCTQGLDAWESVKHCDCRCHDVARIFYDRPSLQA